MWVSRKVWDLVTGRIDDLRTENRELLKANRELMQELLERSGSSRSITGPAEDLPSYVAGADGKNRFSDGRILTRTGQPASDDETVLQKIMEVDESFDPTKLPMPPGTVGA